MALLKDWLCAIFEAFTRKECPEIITVEERYQSTLCENIYYVNTTLENANRVENGIYKKIGAACYLKAWTAFQNAHADTPTVIFNYLRLGFSIGSSIEKNLTNDTVIAFMNTHRAVCKEQMRMIEFVRFSEMENGVYFAKIDPEHNVVPLIMQHFVDRMNIQPFVIFDNRNKIAGIYDLKEWYITETAQLNLPNFSHAEADYKAMWKRFYDTVSIKERVSSKRRQALMPKKYWHNLSELQK